MKINQIVIHRFIIFALLVTMGVIIPIYINKVDVLEEKAERDYKLGFFLGNVNAEIYYDIKHKFPPQTQAWYETYWKVQPETPNDLKKAIQDGRIK